MKIQIFVLFSYFWYHYAMNMSTDNWGREEVGYLTATDKDLGYHIDTIIEDLKIQNPKGISKTSEIEQNRNNHVRIGILKQISVKLTQYYNTPVDALSWFIVLYHWAESVERYTYREIAILIRNLNFFHTGVNGSIMFYNNTSIHKLLVDMGWPSYDKTHQTSIWVEQNKVSTSDTAERKAKVITDKVRQSLSKSMIPSREIGEASTAYASRLLVHVATYYPDIQYVWGRVRARVLNQLTWSDTFTPDSFRDRSK